MIFTLLSALTGITLGVSCNVVVLLVVTIAAIITVGVHAVGDGEPAGVTIGSIVLVWACLQGAYIIGLSSREIVSQIVARLGEMQSRRV